MSLVFPHVVVLTRPHVSSAATTKSPGRKNAREGPQGRAFRATAVRTIASQRDGFERSDEIVDRRLHHAVEGVHHFDCRAWAHMCLEESVGRCRSHVAEWPSNQYHHVQRSRGGCCVFGEIRSPAAAWRCRPVGAGCWFVAAGPTPATSARLCVLQFRDQRLREGALVVQGACVPQCCDDVGRVD